MSLAFVRRAAIVCAAFVVFALLLTVTTRVRAGGSGVLEACVNPGNGMLRLVDASVACHANETRVEWNVTGPEGPQGPQGPQGPAGSSSGGPPFVWVCTPANFPQAASNTRGDVYIFNGSSSTANVALHILDKDGNNLSGVTVPGSSPPVTYPGQTGSATVPLLADHTLDVTFQTPQTFLGDTNASYTVRVVSDQPIAVGSDFEFSGFHTLPCSLLPK